MTSQSRAKMDKRRKELARQERQKEKRARKAAGRESEAGADGSAPEDDPDLAGIQLGPQPPQDEAPPQ